MRLSNKIYPISPTQGGDAGERCEGDYDGGIHSIDIVFMHIETKADGSAAVRRGR